MARILHLSDALLIVDQDTIDVSFAAALVLGEAAHLVRLLLLLLLLLLYLSFASSRLSCHGVDGTHGRRSLLLMSVAVL